MRQERADFQVDFAAIGVRDFPDAAPGLLQGTKEEM